MGEKPTRVLSQENSVVRWLMTDGLRITDAKSFLEAFASRLRNAGVDVCRITTGVPVLHPQLFQLSLGTRQGRDGAALPRRHEPGRDPGQQPDPGRL